ncbi:hypothetical protein [Devosia sp.]|uniref:hypothetical protein n=1 Tax=Devosia sp. TaxID=1871048 RepID=UPI0032661A98
MSGIHRDDRPALIALGLILLAIVLVSVLVRPNHPIEKVAGNLGTEQNAQNKIVQSLTGGSDFNPWQDPVDQWLMAIFSVASAGVSAWAIFEVRKTFRETKRTADEAVRANQTAREIGEAQVRAYIDTVEVTYRVSPRHAHYAREIP